VTTRLYYDDAYLLTFDASVVGVRHVDGRAQVALDRSAFYPTSGGQLHDTGTLTLADGDGGASAHVIDVEAEGDTVWHIVDTPLEVGAIVRGMVDAGRRADHRQQHSGQHVLSASCALVCQAETRSVHLGAGLCTVDLHRELSPDELDALEADANRIVLEDRPVRVRYVDGAETAALPLRRPTGRTGTVRLVDIEGHDLSACGGTHVARTGEIGAIVLRGAERFKGGARLTFVCGMRAVESHRLLVRTLDAAARHVSQGPLDVPAAIVRLQDESRDQRRALDAVRERLSTFEAQSLAASFERIGDLDIMVRLVPDVDATGLRRLGAALVETPGRVVVLLGGAAPHALVIARSAGVTSVDVTALARTVVEAAGGKAGGRGDLVQGGGVTGSVDDISTVVKRLLA
jgi:alanyl-tRNA synthetase